MWFAQTRLYRTYVFNSTLELTERTSVINPQAMFSFVLVSLFLGAIVYFAFNAIKEHRWIKSRSGHHHHKTAADVDSKQDDWGLIVHKSKSSKGKSQ